MARKYRTTPAVASASRRVSALGQRHDPDDPDLAGARRDLRFAKFLEYAAKARAADPPFTAEQWDTLRQVGIYPAPGTRNGGKS